MTAPRRWSLSRNPLASGLPWAMACLLVAFALPALAQQPQSIVNTPHNLSVSGPGPVKAVNETRVCIFCHTPHSARTTAPLWNRNDSTAQYIPYDSPTLKASPGQPTGASKLCLSCHDGTIALGDLVSESAPIAMSGSQVMPPGPGLIGTDLRDDHPISFPYGESLAALPGLLSPPASWDSRVKLDPDGLLQCTTCHDPHDDQWGGFLVMDNLRSTLCRQCHTFPYFDLTPHFESTKQWNGMGENPWPDTKYTDVQSNACLNCHEPHHAGGNVELVTHSKEEEVCLVCHDGNVAQGDLASVFQLPYHHPVEATEGVHQPGESPLNAYGHVECVDCHNPHRARQVQANAPDVQGVMEGVTGIDSSGLPVQEAAYEYQVCFKCHSRDNALPADAIPRQVSTSNTRKEFSPSSPSYHPVEQPGKGTNVPSLISPLNTGSIIYCSDCHGNSDPSAAANGVAGPHGSEYQYILVRQYLTGPSETETPEAYALCYGCHNRDSILGNESFPYHYLHVHDQNAPCSICHDAHGVDFGQGTAQNNAHLINFDVSVVSADSVTGKLEYDTTSPGTGECYLSCHGVDHSPKTYTVGVTTAQTGGETPSRALAGR